MDRIEITVRKNGEEVPLNTISTETFEKLREKKPCKEEKLRHGDYGYGCNNELNIALSDPYRTPYPGLKLFDEDHILVSLSPQQEIKTVLGNIFTDLEALKEPLKHFHIYKDTSEIFYAQIEDDNQIALEIDHKWAHLTLEQLEEIILKLRRLVATAKSKQSSLK